MLNTSICSRKLAPVAILLAVGFLVALPGCNDRQPPAAPNFFNDQPTYDYQLQVVRLTKPGQPYPETGITYAIPEEMRVRVEVRNITGYPVRLLIDEVLPPGSYAATWDGHNEAGDKVENGMYIYYLTADIGQGWLISTWCWDEDCDGIVQ